MTHNRQFRLDGVHYAWILMYCNTLGLFTRTQGDVTAVDSGSTYRIILVVIAAIILVLKLFERTNAITKLFSSALGWFFLYGFVGIISSAYAAQPFYSMWKSMEIMIIALLPAILLVSKDADRSVIFLYRLSLILIGLTVASAFVGLLVAPGLALKPIKGILPYSLQGVLPWLNSNTLGSLAAVAAYASLIQSIRLTKLSKKKWLYRFFFLLSLVCIIFSTSRTAITAFLMGAVVFAFFDRRYFLFGSIFSLAGIIAAVDFLRELTVTYLEKEQSIESLSSLTGRTKGWEMAWAHFLESPYYGSGLASAGRFDVLGDTVTTLHGALFDVLVGVGVIGTLPWLLTILWTGVRLLRPVGGRVRTIGERFGRAELLGLMALLMVRTSTSSGLAFHDRETLLFLSILAAATVGRSAFAQLGGANAVKTDASNKNPTPSSRPVVRSADPTLRRNRP